MPLTLNKYLYGNADPVNHVDPSGNFFTISGTTTAVNRQLILVRHAFATGGRQTGGKAISNLGALVERRIGAIIQQCLKPNARLVQRDYRTGDGKVTVDFLFEMAGRLKAVEVKYQLGSATSEGFARAARQLSSAIKKGVSEVVLVSFKSIVERRGRALLDKIGNPSVGVQIGSILDLSAMMGEFLIEGCIQ